MIAKTPTELLLHDALMQAAIDLDEAADDIEDWARYASPYFQNKHRLKENIEETKLRAFKIRAILTSIQ